MSHIQTTLETQTTMKRFVNATIHLSFIFWMFDIQTTSDRQTTMKRFVHATIHFSFKHLESI